MLIPMLKRLHDQLLMDMPEGAQHSAADCPMCGDGHMAESEAASDHKEGAVKTYTEDEMAAVLVQVAELEAAVAELKSVHQESEIEVRVADVTASFEGEISDLRAQLDTAVLEAQAAKDELAQTLNYFAELEAASVAAEELARVKAERIEKVREVVSFPEEHVAANADRWASLDEEAFVAQLEDWKAIAPKVSSDDDSNTPPAATAMTAAREGSSKASPLSVLRLRNEGVDLRTIRS